MFFYVEWLWNASILKIWYVTLKYILENADLFCFNRKSIYLDSQFYFSCEWYLSSQFNFPIICSTGLAFISLLLLRGQSKTCLGGSIFRIVPETATSIDLSLSIYAIQGLGWDLDSGSKLYSATCWVTDCILIINCTPL